MKPLFKIKKLNNDAIIPTFANKGDAGMDLYVTEDAVIKSHSFGVVSTGLAVEIPENYEIQIRSRSGLAAKSGIAVLNAPGTIDCGYRGEIKIILFNVSNNDFEVKKGMRMAQMVVSKLTEFEIEEVTDFTSTTERGSNGFGSSGK